MTINPKPNTQQVAKTAQPIGSKGDNDNTALSEKGHKWKLGEI